MTKKEFEDKFNFYKTKYNLTWDYDCDLRSIANLIVFFPREEEALKIDVSDGADLEKGIRDLELRLNI